MLKILLSFILFSLSHLVLAASYTVEIPSKTLQENFSALMPIEQQTFYETVIISAADLNLVDKSNKIDATITIEALLPGAIKGAGHGQIAGTLHYDASKGDFYLNKFFIVGFDVDETLMPYKDSVTNAVAAAIINGFSKMPVYTIKDDRKKQQLKTATISSIKVKESILLVTFSTP